MNYGTGMLYGELWKNPEGLDGRVFGDMIISVDSVGVKDLVLFSDLTFMESVYRLIEPCLMRSQSERFVGLFMY